MWRFFLLLNLCSVPVLAEPPDFARQQALRNLLAHDCGACHGLSLQGGLGSALTPQALADKSDAFLVTTILEGRSGTAMPPWKRFLSNSEAQWLVMQLRTMENRE